MLFTLSLTFKGILKVQLKCPPWPDSRAYPYQLSTWCYDKPRGSDVEWAAGDTSSPNRLLTSHFRGWANVHTSRYFQTTVKADVNKIATLVRQRAFSPYLFVSNKAFQRCVLTLTLRSVNLAMAGGKQSSDIGWEADVIFLPLSLLTSFYTLKERREVNKKCK